MKEILIFAGTTEGRRLSECLAKAGIAHTICVATEYGEIVLKEYPGVTVHRGRMNLEEMKVFIMEEHFAAVVDATHPYALVVSENIRTAMKGMKLPYLRLQRDTGEIQTGSGITVFENNEACAEALESIEGNILLTTGSKELKVYCSRETLKDRLYVRVLPGTESLKLCEQQGITGKQILALQGPFGVELNVALIHQYQIACLVTKKSGKAGGFEEKAEAARRCGIPVFLIGQEKVEKGEDFFTVCGKLEGITGRKIIEKNQYHIILAGTGMGTEATLTKEVRDAIGCADILMGAKRLIEEFQPKIEKRPYYLPEQMLPYLVEMQEKEVFEHPRTVVILFSGDSGFYSGCGKVYSELKEAVLQNKLNADIRILPGISSVSYLSACTGESYQDAKICSIHGKELPNLVNILRREKKTYLLMSGAKDVRFLGQLLLCNHMEKCQVIAGYQLSYPEQKILELSPEECLDIEEEGLYLCLIKNPDTTAPILTHGRGDGEFIRGKVPMTKEEIREVSICKMRLHKDSVLYDIGGGTGSVSIEAAALSESLLVYTIEKKEEALELIRQNKENAGLENINIIRGEAPECLLELETPTHAFIGGSSGKLKEILGVLYEKNPHMRVVINAISMETISELKEVLEAYPVSQEEVIQMQVNRAKKAGRYHLMQAENPVWILAFTFGEEEIC